MANQDDPRKPAWMYTQSGVLAYQRRAGVVRILLVTSRSGKRWVIPKGVVDRGMTASDSAAKEAWEEAGVRGHTSGDPCGEYTYEKWGGVCRVEVFAMEVQHIADKWQEDGVRTREWMDMEAAIERVDESALKHIIARVAVSLATG